MRNRSARPVKSSDFPAGFRSTIGSSPEDALIFLNYRSTLGSWERALELRVPWFQIVRFWSKADICSAKRHVRSTPESDRESVFQQKSCLLYIRKRTCAVQSGMSAKGQ